MKVVVVGGGAAGLLSALAFRRHGADVTILEADDTPMPDAHERDTAWFRKGTPHARLAHGFMAGFTRTLAAISPETLAAIRASDVIERRIEHQLPPSITDRSSHPGDEEILLIGSRRPHVEWFLRRAALQDEGIAWRSGVHVQSLVARNGSVPHVTGVQTGDGTVDADVVIDAAGRRSRAQAWLSDHGVKVEPSLLESCNQMYRTRFYALRDPEDRPELASGFVLPVPSPSHGSLLFSGDHGTLQVALGSLPGDTLFDRAVEPEVFHALLSEAVPIAAWIHPERAEPISDVAIFGNVQNRLLRLVDDGTPLVTGLHLVGDSLAISNPQYGRGVSQAAVHARAVADIVTGAPGDPHAQALAVDQEITRMVEPSVLDSIEKDRARTRGWRAAVDGEVATPYEWPRNPEGVTPAKLMRAFATDPVVWRGIARGFFLLDPIGRALADDDVLERIRAAEPADMPAPDADAIKAYRARVAEIIAAA